MILSAVVVIGALTFVPAALATNSSVETYGGQGGEVAALASSNSGDPGDPTGTVDSSGALPFTGLDLELLAGGGLLLLLAGVGMARIVARREDAV